MRRNRITTGFRRSKKWLDLRRVRSTKPIGGSGLAVALVGVFGGVAVAWFVGAKPASLPLWPAAVFAAAFVASVYLVIAPEKGLFPYGPPPVDAPEPVKVSKKHEKQLRELAAGLQQQIDAGELPVYARDSQDAQFLESIFAAHFPAIHAAVASFLDETGKTKTAKAELLREAGAAMEKRFDRNAGWKVDEIIAGFRSHQNGIAGGKAPALEEDDHQGRLIWADRVIYEIRGLDPGPERFSQLAGAAVSVDHWMRAVVDSEAAKQFQTSQPASKALGTAALDALRPIAQYQPIYKAVKCANCGPEGPTTPG